MGRDGVYPVETPKFGSLLHYVIAYLGLMTCTSGCYYSLCNPDYGRGERPKHVEYSCSY
jgi:hypothetical protein